MLKPAEFQNRWTELVSDCQKTIPQQFQIPKLTHHECQELLLACAILLRFNEQPAAPRALDLIRQLGEPISQFVVRILDRRDEFLEKIRRVVEEVTPKRYEPFTFLMDLTQLAQGRKTKGVYYTPQPVATKVATLAKQQIARNKVDPLSLQVLEPSVGAGVFIHGWLDAHGNDHDASEAHYQSLANWTCVDISPAAIVVAQWLLLDRVIRDEQSIAQLPLFLAADTLTCTPHSIYSKLGISHIDDTWVQDKLRRHRYSLVIGNPPFGTLTSQTDPWVLKLLHGGLPEDSRSRSYFEANGQPINERKTWLHDDYVKFMRFSQWHVERSPCGTMALVLNSGFLNNLSFRGLRFHLLDCFEQLDIIDLGGDSRNHANRDDENVFQIETGVAAIVGSTALNPSVKSRTPPSQRLLVKLRGSRESKYQWCLGKSQPIDLRLDSKVIEASPPTYRMDFPDSSSCEIEYESGWSLSKIFDKHWSAPVTARDHLVIDFTPERLVEKIERFLDPAKSDDLARIEFFPKPRSKRYPAGDSRSWKLGEARERLRHSTWRSQIHPCDYRPFDRRYILWHEAMIDWPRREFIRAMQLPGNSCLISRRQAPPGTEYSFFWSSQGIPIDGILRNDNRGNEYCFPLFVQDSTQPTTNLSSDFIRHVSERWRRQTLDPQMVFDGLIAQFHGSEYRTLFQTELGYDFPKAFIPQSLEKAEQLAKLGRKIRLIQTDITKLPACQPESPELFRKPAFGNGQLNLGPNTRISLTDEIWNLKIGSHQVIRKLCSYRLQANFGLNLEPLVHQTIQLAQELQAACQEVDELIESFGGFRQTFDWENKPTC